MWESELASLKLSEHVEKLAWEARAQITWGDASEVVQQWLVEQRVDSFQAALIVEACLRDRGQSVRLQGAGDLLRGLPLAAASLAGMLALFYFGGIVGGKPFGLLFAVSGFGIIVGVRWTVLGIERLLAGARTRGSISDLDD